MFIDIIAPKKFLSRWELRTGAKFVGICMCLLMAACTVTAIVQTLQMAKCNEYSWKIAYSFSITSIIYCVFIFVVNIWFLWGIKKEKATVVLCWAVITVAWLAKSFCLLIVLLCIYSSEANAITWMVCLALSLVALCIFLYGLLVCYGYWLQLKKKPNATTDVATEN